MILKALDGSECIELGKVQKVGILQVYILVLLNVDLLKTHYNTCQTRILVASMWMMLRCRAKVYRRRISTTLSFSGVEGPFALGDNDVEFHVVRNR